MKQHNEKPPSKTLPSRGTLTLRDKDGKVGQLYGPEVGSGKSILYVFSGDYPLFPNDKARSMQFDEFPSATRFFFYADFAATEDPNSEFWFECVTTRKRTSTVIRQFVNILSHDEGTMIEPGLRMVRWHKRGQTARVMDELSSVRITASTYPPTTPITLKKNT